MYQKLIAATSGLFLLTSLNMSNIAYAQNIEWDAECYNVFVDGIPGEFLVDDEGYLGIFDTDGNFLANTPDECFEILSSQPERIGLPPPPPQESPPPPPQEQVASAPNTDVTSGSTTVSGNNAAEFVAAHNKWRREVGVGDLSWSDQLAQSAQAWADNLQNQNCQMVHSTGNHGENLANAWSNPAPVTDTATMAVDGWGSEKRFYDYDSNTCSNPNQQEGCGHYTQMVWRSTQQVGCGTASCMGGDGSESKIWVCQYSPGGNYEGEKPY